MEILQPETIQQAAHGDTEAFRLVYDASYGFVYAVVLGIVKSRAEADDVTQRVYLRLWKRLWMFRFHSSFKTWLYRIATNEALNALRAARRRKDTGSEYQDAVEHPDPAGGPEHAAVASERTSQIDRAFAALPAPQRACLVLRELEGYQYEEIARMLGVNINTVRTRLRRARQTLSKLIPAEVM